MFTNYHQLNLPGLSKLPKPKVQTGVFEVDYDVEQWTVEVTMNGPALFDDCGDCHGAVSMNTAYKHKTSLWRYVKNMEDERDIRILVDTRALKDLAESCALSKIYMCDR